MFWSWKVVPDHIHLFVQCKPADAPTKIVKTLKGISGLHLFRIPDLRKKLWKGVLWNYVRTTGHVSAQTIERYIRE
jgi:putative transposase